MEGRGIQNFRKGYLGQSLYEHFRGSCCKEIAGNASWQLR